MDWLGHSDIATTNMYTHTNFSRKISVGNVTSAILPNIAEGKNSKVVINGDKKVISLKEYKKILTTTSNSDK